MLLLGMYLLLRGEKNGLLFGKFSMDRPGHVFFLDSKKVMRVLS